MNIAMMQMMTSKVATAKNVTTTKADVQTNAVTPKKSFIYIWICLWTSNVLNKPSSADNTIFGY